MTPCVPELGVYWLRFRLQPDSSLRGKKVLLGFGDDLQAEVFLNGQLLFTTPTEKTEHRNSRRFAGPALSSVLLPV
jgi:hypothetical protein